MAETSAPKSGAVGAEKSAFSAADDADPAALIAAWPKLSSALKRRIVRLVEAAE